MPRTRRPLASIIGVSGILDQISQGSAHRRGYSMPTPPDLATLTLTDCRSSRCALQRIYVSCFHNRKETSPSTTILTGKFNPDAQRQMELCLRRAAHCVTSRFRHAWYEAGRDPFWGSRAQVRGLKGAWSRWQARRAIWRQTGPVCPSDPAPWRRCHASAIMQVLKRHDDCP